MEDTVQVHPRFTLLLLPLVVGHRRSAAAAHFSTPIATTCENRDTHGSISLKDAHKDTFKLIVIHDTHPNTVPTNSSTHSPTCILSIFSSFLYLLYHFPHPPVLYLSPLSILVSLHTAIPTPFSLIPRLSSVCKELLHMMTFAPAYLLQVQRSSRTINHCVWRRAWG